MIKSAAAQVPQSVKEFTLISRTFELGFVGFSILLPLLLSSCGKGAGPEGSPKSAAASLFGSDGLSGAWETKCVAKDGFSTRERFEFSGDQFTVEYKGFDDTTCTDSQLLHVDHETNGEAYQTKTPELVGWMTIDYLVKEDLRILTHLREVALYNREKRFGYGDWQINVPKDISGRKYRENSTALPSIGDARVRTFLIQGNLLKVASYVTGKAQEVEDESHVYTRK